MILFLIDKYFSILSQPTATVSILSIQAYSKRLFAWKDKSRSFVHRVTYRKSFDLMYPRTISACFCDNTRRNKRIILCDQQIQNKQKTCPHQEFFPINMRNIYSQKTSIWRYCGNIYISYFWFFTPFGLTLTIHVRWFSSYLSHMTVF